MNTPQKRKTRDGAILCLVGIPAPTRRPLKEHREPISSPRFGPQGQPHPRRSAPAPRKSGGWTHGPPPVEAGRGLMLVEPEPPPGPAPAATVNVDNTAPCGGRRP